MLRILQSISLGSMQINASKVQHEQSKPRACLSLLRFGGAIQPEVGVAMQVEEGLQHIQHLGHLGEDEGLVAASLQLVQQLCQLLQSYEVGTPIVNVGNNAWTDR